MTTHPSLVPFIARFLRLAFLLSISAALLGAGFVPPAQGQDNIGIFWDENYTQVQETVDTYPAILTGYLVLKNPTNPSGLLGWECCVDIDGPAQFLSWDIEGQAINAGSPPCFVVGISPDPIPSTGDVLLATFMVMITEPQAVIFSIGPLQRPSVPGQMSFIPFDDPSGLLPMTTADGQPEVAWVNQHIPNLFVDPLTLHFDNTVIGTEAVKSVSVTNAGLFPGYIEAGLTGDCGPYSLPGLSGPISIPAGSTVDIEVAFAPVTTEVFFCSLSLAGGLDDVAMVGSGRELEISWQAPTEVDFGPVGVGAVSNQAVTIKNTGEVAFTIDPFIPATCPEFTIASGNYSSSLLPGNQRTIYVAFRPSSVDSFTCELFLGSALPPVELKGLGRDPLLNWSIWPPTFDFGSVGLGNSQSILVTIQNTGEAYIPVAPEIPASCPEFTISSGGSPQNLAPGSSYSFRILFTPVNLGSAVCEIGLGEVIPGRTMFGTGVEPVLSWVAPTSHDFGTVGVGNAEWFTFSIFNNGDVTFEVDPSLPDSTQGFTLVSGTTKLVLPNQLATMTVQYLPLVPGPGTGTLFLGSTVPPIALQGVGEERPEDWAVIPSSMEFAWLLVGTYQEQEATFINQGGTFIDVDVTLGNPDLGFSILHGGGVSQVAPGQSLKVGVRFRPLEAGVFETILDFGPGLTSIPVIGAAETSEDACIVEPDSLIFGPLTVGDTQSRSYSVTNNGHQDLLITPRTDSPGFLSSGLDRTLGPGQTAYFSVLFQPLSEGTFTGTIDLGSQFCFDVVLTGTATLESGTGENQVGIFFDSDFTYIEAQTWGPNEVVQGYLVMIKPSETSGVGAWELAADIDGNGLWLSWDLEGQHINVGTYNEFIVGIGGSPLPYAQNVLLATFQILIPEPYPNIVYLELGPIRTPSIPGQMVWAPWHDPGQLMPLIPFTGQRVVAGINWSTVGLEVPAPLASVTGGSVDLEWPVPENPGDGCHLYRRDAAGEATRLTDQPLTGFGPVLKYTDTPAGYGAGAVLYYSYTVVSDGIEGDRSPETEVKFAGVPSVATRLLPNIPNPFNPMTEIRFELDRPQQTRVVVYDVTGRLIKVLADGHLGSGPHERIWQGRDNSGRQVPSGAYYVRLVTGRRVDHQKIMLLK